MRKIFILVLAILCIPTLVYGAAKTLPTLTESTAVDADDIFLCREDDDTEDNKCPGSQIATMVFLQTADGLFLGDGAVIEFNAGDVTLTHSENALVLDGGYFALNGNFIAVNDGTGFIDVDGNNVLLFNTVADSVNHVEITDAATEGSPSIYAVGDVNVRLTLGGDNGAGVVVDGVMAADGIDLTSGAIINFDNDDVTLTHSSAYLTMVGGTLAVPFLDVGGIEEAGYVRTLGETSGDLAFGAVYDVNSFFSFEIYADGALYWGDGGGQGDVSLVRSEEGVLQLDGELITTGTVTAGVGFDCDGAVDCDFGSDDITDMTFVTDGGTITMDGFINIPEIAAPGTPDEDTVSIWAEDKEGLALLKFKNSDDFERTFGRDNVLVVRNTSGDTVTKGQLVYISGSTGQIPDVDLAQADSESTVAHGIMANNVLDNGFGYMLVLGYVQGVDTDTLSEGTILYLDPDTPGAFTDTPPVFPDIKQVVGIVAYEHAEQGIIAVDIGVGLLRAAVASSGNLSDVTFDVGNVDTTEFGYLDGVTSALQTQIDTKAVETQTFQWTGHIETPADKTYHISIDSAYAGTITEVVTDADSGTGTWTCSVGATPLGGTANSVSSTENAQAHASSNTFVAGDEITCAITSNSSLDDMRWKIEYTRVLED